MTNQLSVNRIYEDLNIEGTDHSATTLRVSQGLQEGGPEGADTYVSKVMDQGNHQIMIGNGQQNSWNPHSGYTQNFHSPQVPLSRDDSDIWQLYPSSIGNTTPERASAPREELCQGQTTKDHWWSQLPFKNNPELFQVQGHFSFHTLSQGQRQTTQSLSLAPHIISCGRCLSRNNSHSASNCHSVTYCNVCNNWSHSYSNCKKAPTNRS